jgi:hypothetical protein
MADGVYKSARNSSLINDNFPILTIGKIFVFCSFIRKYIFTQTKSWELRNESSGEFNHIQVTARVYPEITWITRDSINRWIYVERDPLGNQTREVKSGRHVNRPNSNPDEEYDSDYSDCITSDDEYDEPETIPIPGLAYPYIRDGYTSYLSQDAIRIRVYFDGQNVIYKHHQGAISAVTGESIDVETTVVGLAYGLENDPILVWRENKICIYDITTGNKLSEADFISGSVVIKFSKCIQTRYPVESRLIPLASPRLIEFREVWKQTKGCPLNIYRASLEAPLR